MEDKISSLLHQVNRELKQEISALSAQLQQFIEEKKQVSPPIRLINLDVEKAQAIQNQENQIEEIYSLRQHTQEKLQEIRSVTTQMKQLIDKNKS